MAENKNANANHPCKDRKPKDEISKKAAQNRKKAPALSEKPKEELPEDLNIPMHNENSQLIEIMERIERRITDALKTGKVRDINIRVNVEFVTEQDEPNDDSVIDTDLPF